MTTKFEINKTYETRSICDHDCVFSYIVIKRTAKFMTIKDKFGDIKRVGIKIYEDAENAYPEGNYSMCPVISANRNAA